MDAEGNADLEAFGRPLFAETSFDGVGFGLGFSVVLDAAANKVTETGGQVRVPPTEIPVGKFSVVSDPQGGIFSIISIAQSC